MLQTLRFRTERKPEENPGLQEQVQKAQVRVIKQVTAAEFTNFKDRMPICCVNNE